MEMRSRCWGRQWRVVYSVVRVPLVVRPEHRWWVAGLLVSITFIRSSAQGSLLLLGATCLVLSLFPSSHGFWLRAVLRVVASQWSCQLCGRFATQPGFFDRLCNAENDMDARRSKTSFKLRASLFRKISATCGRQGEQNLDINRYIIATARHAPSLC